jgi:SpoVK/Ycf46/Vps4 family AAA+-type ATPase
MNTRDDKLAAFGELFAPDEAAEPILAGSVREALTEWLEEIWAEDDLLEVGLEPRRRAIFDGLPGTGKTTLAHHLAARLGLRMLAVRPERLLSKWVNQTGEQIGELFDLVKARKGAEPIVLFLDEFDALAQSRSSDGQSAAVERNKAVNVLLQRIERFDGYLIAATNFADRIDPAVWRRFDVQITLDPPDQDARERIVARYLAPYGLPAPALAVLAESLETGSPALIRKLCEGLKRQLVLGPKLKKDMGLEAVVGRVLAGVQPHASAGKPRLWSLGVEDKALAALPWPPPLASEIEDETPPLPATPAPPTSADVLTFRRPS